MLTKEQIESLKAAYERDGVAIVPSLFSKDEVAKIRAAAIMALQESHPKRGALALQVKPSDDGVEFPALLFWPATVSAYLNRIRCDERISQVVRAVLGDDVKQLNNQVYFRLPGDGDEFAWHQDLSFRTPKEDFNQIETGYLQTLVVVDEITEENGAVEYVRGSHKNGDLNLVPRDGSEAGLRNFVRGGFQGQKICAKPGDFMIWSVMVVHGSEKNLTADRSRMTYMNGFARADACKKKFPVYMHEGKVRTDFSEEFNEALRPESCPGVFVS